MKKSDCTYIHKKLYYIWLNIKHILTNLIKRYDKSLRQLMGNRITSVKENIVNEGMMIEYNT